MFNSTAASDPSSSMVSASWPARQMVPELSEFVDFAPMDEAWLASQELYFDVDNVQWQ